MTFLDTILTAGATAFGGPLAGTVTGAALGATGSSAPAGGYALGQIPGQPSGAAVAGALARASGPQRNAIFGILQTYAPWERGTPQEIMQSGDLMAWLAWGGGNGVARGTGEKALQAAVSQMLAGSTQPAVQVAGPGYAGPGSTQDVAAAVTYGGDGFSASASYGDRSNPNTALIIAAMVAVVVVVFMFTRKRRR
jgi:hypothetical protein